MNRKPLAVLSRFEALDTASKSSLAEELAAALGAGWEPSSTHAPRALAVRSAPLGLEFFAVPGGSFSMGLTEDDVSALAELGLDREEVEFTVEDLGDARPVRLVTVEPFLVSRSFLMPADIERLSGGELKNWMTSWSDAKGLAAKHGCRLPSEAELEWLVRDGSQATFVARVDEQIDGPVEADDVVSQFGLKGLFEKQWAHDAYHASYVGAPSSSAPWEDDPWTSPKWKDGQVVGASRSFGAPEEFEGRFSFAGMLCATRMNHTVSTASVRLVRPLP